MKKSLAFAAFLLTGVYSVYAQKTTPEQTEYYTPVPPVITPGITSSQPPSDAIILFDGTNLDQWVLTKDAASAAKRDIGR